MRTLVIDSATEACSAALFEDGALRDGFCEVIGRGHAERLVPMIAELPGKGEADRIVVSLGPGSFTGVRIGVAAARALALAWGIPLHGYSALGIIAAKAAAAYHQSGPVAVTITGGHGELFWQTFSADGLEPIGKPASTPITELARQLEHSTIYGTGAETLVTARGHGMAVSLYPDAADYPLVAGLAPLPPSPIYCRGADARPMAERAAP